MCGIHVIPDRATERICAFLTNNDADIRTRRYVSIQYAEHTNLAEKLFFSDRFGHSLFPQRWFAFTPCMLQERKTLRFQGRC